MTDGTSSRAWSSAGIGAALLQEGNEPRGNFRVLTDDIRRLRWIGNKIVELVWRSVGPDHAIVRNVAVRTLAEGYAAGSAADAAETAVALGTDINPFAGAPRREHAEREEDGGERDGQAESVSFHGAKIAK